MTQDGQRIPLQTFTRVHLVPRVNGTAAAALVFERSAQEPLAISLPLEVMGQVFGVLPEVIAQSAAVADTADSPFDVSVPWVLEQLELQSDADQASLQVQVQGVRLQLHLKPEMVLMLAKQLGGKAKPKAVKSLKASKSTVASSVTAKKAVKTKKSPEAIAEAGSKVFPQT
jgi:hypothetical protein